MSQSKRLYFLFTSGNYSTHLNPFQTFRPTGCTHIPDRYLKKFLVQGNLLQFRLEIVKNINKDNAESHHSDEVLGRRSSTAIERECWRSRQP